MNGAFAKDKFNLFYFVAFAIAFLIVLIRCINVPFAHDEVATFYYYIQSEQFLPFLSHIDANGHFLNSLLGWISFKLFGSSVLALRLPCLFAFLVLGYGVYKHCQTLNNTLAKIILTTAFVLSFNIINFYSLCRGYGLSISFLVLALYYFFNYLQNSKFSYALKFVLFAQIALCANLTLVFTLLIATGIMMLFQIKSKQLFSIKNLLLLALNFGLVFFWVKYAFYLQENGALYYGSGNHSYWKTTFESLLDTVFIKHVAVYIVTLVSFAVLFVSWCIQLFKYKLKFLSGSKFGLSFFMLLSLIAAFHFLKLFFHVNYPEDRTGLFFYILFILSIAFLLDEFELKPFLAFSIFPIYFFIHFALNINFSKHAWGFYETMPKEFFDILLAEQKKTPRPITIGGHRVLELFFSFYNYNSEEKLNHMMPPELMSMNCDYYVTWKKDKPYYDKYYTELANAKYWNMVLLKRKVEIERGLVMENNEAKEFKGADEYYSFYEKIDTTFISKDPIMVEFDISISNAPIPLNAFLVLQVDVDGKSQYFRRTALNWMKYDWNDTRHFKTCIQTDSLPLQKCRLVAFLWNIEKKEITFKLNSLKLYHLKAEGINEVSKAIE